MLDGLGEERTTSEKQEQKEVGWIKMATLMGGIGAIIWLVYAYGVKREKEVFGNIDGYRGKARVLGTIEDDAGNRVEISWDSQSHRIGTQADIDNPRMDLYNGAKDFRTALQDAGFLYRRFGFQPIMDWRDVE